MGNSIFKPQNSCKEWQPLVLDKKARKAVLKQNFSVDAVPSEVDSIVIGSGIGGLTTAACLSLAGHKVLVLEQHHKAGGCCHIWKEKGYEWDTGIHYMGQLASPHSETQVILDNICANKIKFQPMDDIYDEVIIGDQHIPIHKGELRCRQELHKHFPEDKDAIDKFFALCQSVESSEYTLGILKLLAPVWLARWLVSSGWYRLVGRWFTYVEHTSHHLISTLTDNHVLHTVLNYCYGDYGVSPKRSPFCMQAMLWNYFKSEGGFYPVGGGSEFPYQIVQTIRNAGGAVLVRAKVAEIILSGVGESGGSGGGRAEAVGVRVQYGTDKLVEIRAPVIVSAAGYLNTYTRMIAPDISRRIGIDVSPGSPLHAGAACVILFVGLAGTSSELGLPSRNYWVYAEGDTGGDAMDRYLGIEEAHRALDLHPTPPLMFISFPSAKDPTWEQRYPGKSTCEVVTFARYSWFSEWQSQPVKARGSEYERVKERMQLSLWHAALQHFPHIEDKVEVMDLGTPLSVNHYLGSTAGEIYGLDHNQGKFSPQNMVKLRPTQPVRNLYLSGQDVMTCGVAGGMTGGLMCASEVLHQNLWLQVQACRLKLAVRETVSRWVTYVKGLLTGVKKQD